MASIGVLIKLQANSSSLASFWRDCQAFLGLFCPSSLLLDTKPTECNQLKYQISVSNIKYPESHHLLLLVLIGLQLVLLSGAHQVGPVSGRRS